ncbi:MAG: beta-N-acetylhexosaminidase [Acidobacteriia bacterium]|nr:beta-N-acetylhexosaminidase [Terriglobia bacterium]
MRNARMVLVSGIGSTFAKLLLAVVLASIGSSLWAQSPQLIPQPREFQATSQPFPVTTQLEIVLLIPSVADDRFVAEALQTELKLDAGKEFPIIAAQAPPPDRPAIVLGYASSPVMGEWLKRQNMAVQPLGDQGYVLDVEPNLILVAGKDAAGLFYGVQTLRQLTVGEGQDVKILGARVRDWPTLLYRGTQVDMSRGPVPKLNYLKQIVRTIAEFKMNQLYMYIEDSFRLDGQPLVGLLSDTLTRDDWKDLVAYAARYHVDIIPATEDCGHLHKILRFEEYSGLSERPHGHVLAAGDPQALKFLDGMYAQMAPVFPASMYHIGCDETFELGQGRTAGLVQKSGYGRVYVDNLIQVHDLVRRYNKDVMFWGDIAVEHPEMIPSLPKDLIVASWVYGAQPSYDKWLKPFAGTGLRIFVCPWVANTSQIVPDYEEAATNIEGFLTDGKRAGAIGTNITVWNDDGESLYGPNWWSIVYGAACAWEHGITDVRNFDQKFDWTFYRNTDHRFTEALKKLGHMNEVTRAGGPVEVYDQRFGGTDDALFWQDPFSPNAQRQIQKDLPVAELVRRTAEESYTVFVDSESRARRNSDTLADLGLAALRLDALAMRYQFVQEISQRYSDALAHEHDKDQALVGSDFNDITSTNGRIEDLRDYTTRLTELYRQRWLDENLPTWLPNILLRYRLNNEMWQALSMKFEQIELDHWQGKPLPPAAALGLLPTSPPPTGAPPSNP